MHQKIAIEDDGHSSNLCLKQKDKSSLTALSMGSMIFQMGTHLDARAWNEAMNLGAIVVDMRNHYESEIGHFKGVLPTV